MKGNKVRNINTGLYFAKQIGHTTPRQPTSRLDWEEGCERRDSWPGAVKENLPLLGNAWNRRACASFAGRCVQNYIPSLLFFKTGL